MSTGGAAIGRIVVGVDGSPPSRAALRWAVHQAHITCSEVDAVTAWQHPPRFGTAVPDVDEELGRAAARTLAETVDAMVPTEENAVDIRLRTREGNAAQVLLDMARGADLLVLGSRGLGGFEGAVLGSVSTHCARHAKCPVVIVRGDAAG